MKKSPSNIALGLGILLIVAGCASTKVTSRQQYTGGDLARPDHIWVYDFARLTLRSPGNTLRTPHLKPASRLRMAARRELKLQRASSARSMKWGCRPCMQRLKRNLRSTTL
jgi:hypothetical protein